MDGSRQAQAKCAKIHPVHAFPNFCMEISLMKKILPLAALGLAALCHTACAEDIRPGLWKITMQSAVDTAPDWKPQAFELSQCLTESDAQNPAGLMLGMSSKGATGCDFPNKQYAGNSLKFDVSCAGTLGIRGRGEVTYTATTLDGFLDVNLGEADKINMHNTLHASYLGQCPAAGGGQ